MEGILILAHGSRAKETEKTLEKVLECLKQKIPNTVIEHAFMEFSDKTVAKGVASLVSHGVSRIKVAPYFLFSGIHIREDIPQLLNECISNYSDLSVEMCETLGFDERLADILVDRIKG